MNRERGDGLGPWSLRLRQARLLAPLVARTIRLLPIVATGGFAFILAFVAHLHHRPGVGHLHAGAIFLSLGAGFVLDDSAEGTVAGVPATRLWRRSLRVTLILPLLVAIWAMLLWYAGTGGREWVLSMQLAGILLLTLAVAALASHLVPDGMGGIATGPTILLFFFSQNSIPPRYVPLPFEPLTRGWFDLYGRWYLAVAFGILIFVLASLDPARRPFLARARHHVPPPQLPFHEHPKAQPSSMPGHARAR
jgi:hypothetical protein